MTNMPEARLAREAELPYASIAMVTDFDCWRDQTESVDVAQVLEQMRANTVKAKALLDRLTQAMSAKTRSPSPDGIETVLDTAIITPGPARDPHMVQRLAAIAGRVFG